MNSKNVSAGIKKKMERVEGEGVEIRRGMKKRHRVREKKADKEKTNRELKMEEFEREEEKYVK